MIYAIAYSITSVAALLYAATTPWQGHAPHDYKLYPSSRWVSLLIGARIICAGFYLAILLLYLPTIHFILNMILFTLIVGIYLSYKTVKAR